MITVEEDAAVRVKLKELFLVCTLFHFFFFFFFWVFSIYIHQLILYFYLVCTESEQCMLPGCTKRKYYDVANQRMHDYCGRGHAYEAQQKGNY